MRNFNIVLIIFFHVFPWKKANSQIPVPTFEYQYIPKSEFGTKDKTVKKSIQNIVTVKYLGFYDSTTYTLTVNQETESPEINGIAINTENKLSTYINLLTDSIFLLDSDYDSLVSYKLMLPAFYSSGEIKIITGYKCVKYTFKDKELSDFEVWLSDDLPYYINPGVYNKVLNKGLVSIINKEFGEIRLINVNNLNITPVKMPDMAKKIQKDSLHPLLQK